ncbi:MAG: dipeptide ABC transporter ATP-binding protein [Lachnospira sp.]|nr:dipeptide ABC transporter ATP-binding protein [Lachnospira sp.]
MEREKILEVKNLKKYFPVQNTTIHAAPKSVKAVDDVSFNVFKGETFSLVGESGCGKSTTGRCLIGLIPATSGEVMYNGKDVTKLNNKERRLMTSELQMIFQDPYSSLDPRMTVGSIIEEPLLIHKICKSKQERMERAMDMLKKVGLREDQYYRYPHEFSGGQKQRIGIARALILKPKLIVCDEPVSALDVSIQSQVLNLLSEMKKELDITYVFISHNMSVVRYISDRIGVMYLGHLVEVASTEELYSNPLHPYTQALLSAVPEINPHIKKKQITLQGDIPSPLNPPSGCVFHNRCPHCKPVCEDMLQNLQEVKPGHWVACVDHQAY